MQALEQAFNIKTVGDLGNNRHFRAAQLLAQLTEAGAKFNSTGRTLSTRGDN
jgi:hypothetical protein